VRAHSLGNDETRCAQDRQFVCIQAEVIGEVKPAGSLGAEAFADEIDWIKEYVEPPVNEQYLAVQRTGRGGRLSMSQRETLLRIFGRYEERLRSGKCCDWGDIPLRVLELVSAGRIAAPRYHALLVDETQDFAPSWFRVLLCMLKPETNLLFLAGDGAQRVPADLC
jgi:superfamily I DNA/RNA helicase